VTSIVVMNVRPACDASREFVAGLIARFFHPANKYEPNGFILTTVLGIVGAVVATYLGPAVAGFIASIVGAIIVLVIWGLIAPRLERT
jgi:uncharacterized membrane protein YeaQ/YmgE (transglycosylase-associated protein family)